MEILNRNTYIKRIKPFIGKNIIKVITGQRRVGKSYFLRQIINHIKTEHKSIPVIYINKEDYQFDSIKTYEDLINHVENKNKESSRTALFIDEIQDIQHFEKALRHFYTKEIYDIYCTGSNANLLSGELATLLSGRTIELEINSLTYPEYLHFHGINDGAKSFEQYMMYGGMPNLIHFEQTDEVVYDYLLNVFNTIIVKDVLTRYSIRNVTFLRDLALFIADNTESVVSSKKISDYLKSQNIKLSHVLVQDYLSYLSETYFIHKVKRSSLQGKKIFEIGEKYFFNDVGMRNALVGFKAIDLGKILENIVYLHLRSAGYRVTVGKDRTKEVDFVAQKNNEFLYIQVAYRLDKESTINREFGNLEKIKNNYPKMVVTMDKSSTASVNGIKHMHIRDFCKYLIEE